MSLGYKGVKTKSQLLLTLGFFVSFMSALVRINSLITAVAIFLIAVVFAEKMGAVRSFLSGLLSGAATIIILVILGWKLGFSVRDYFIANVAFNTGLYEVGEKSLSRFIEIPFLSGLVGVTLVALVTLFYQNVRAFWASIMYLSLSVTFLIYTESHNPYHLLILAPAFLMTWGLARAESMTATSRLNLLLLLAPGVFLSSAQLWSDADCTLTDQVCDYRFQGLQLQINETPGSHAFAFNQGWPYSRLEQKPDAPFAIKWPLIYGEGAILRQIDFSLYDKYDYVWVYDHYSSQFVTAAELDGQKWEILEPEVGLDRYSILRRVD